MGVCLNQELVERYAAGNCSSSERRAVEEHVTQCENCQQRIESTRSELEKADKDAADEVTQEVPVKQDEYPTKSMPDVLTSLHDKHIFTKDFDSMFEGYRIISQIGEGGVSTRRRRKNGH